MTLPHQPCTAVRSNATHAAIEAVCRNEWARIVAVVARMTRDVGLAEECAQEALVAALAHWPAGGVPDNPAAWLTTASKRKALDLLRHQRMRLRQHEALGHDLAAQQALLVPDIADALDAARQDCVGDDLLRLLFIACHPVLSPDARAALTLRLLCGLTTAEIARAFLAPEPTVAQRIVRAKKTLASAQVPFDLPVREALPERLVSVLEVVYLVFNEGYAATQGEDWMRPALCAEAVRLAGLLAELAPDEPEVQGLLALLELHVARAPARVDAQGRPVLLMAQDRRCWDALSIRRGLVALERAKAACLRRGEALGPYALQAAIAACHAEAHRAEDTDWRSIVVLYDALARQTPTPVVALNRAVAVSMAFGAAQALPLVEQLAGEPQLQAYPWFHTVKGELLARLGRLGEAGTALVAAAALTQNGAERASLLRRAAALQESAGSGPPGP